MSTHVENGEGIFSFLQGFSVLWRNICFVTAESNACSIADGKRETKGHKLPSISTRPGLSMKTCDIAHPCNHNRIVVIAHSLHHANARYESQDDEARGHAEKCYHDRKHRWPTILHGHRCRVRHQCRRHSSSAAPSMFMGCRVRPRGPDALLLLLACRCSSCR